ncbi:MAG TPA: PPC domain-containing protein, partial [Thermoanaerobaculia bacterium]|nr:PPC domain-containing protein [Thermoanaerobaculia bacterium]
MCPILLRSGARLLTALAAALLAACSPGGDGGAAKSASAARDGALEASDPSFDAGEHYDAYPVEAVLGETIAVDLVARDFDPYLVLVSPSGAWFENDDHEGSEERSRIELLAEESGEWTVYATSFQGGALGDYRLSIDTSPAALPGHRFERGALGEGDAELDGGEWADRLTFRGEAGEYVWVDLRSAHFDPYLAVRAPGGETWENDDFLRNLTHAALGLTLPEAGEYEVIVTSASAAESGAWDLILRRDLHPAPIQRSEEGELAAGDESLRSGEWVDEYEFEATAGQRLELVLSSEEFDTYLILVDPRGGHVENDDDEYGDSSIRSLLTRPGVHRVLVTSNEVGATGRYSLSIDLGEVRPIEVEQLEIGTSRSGRLESGDENLSSGELVDRYLFHAEAGTAVELVVSSPDFDTYVWLDMPDGTVLENNDDWDDPARSRLELTLPQTGTYEVGVSSFEPGSTGAYRVELRRGQARPFAGVPGRTFALLMGISDYGGRMSDLDNTALDARLLGDALVERTGMDAGDAILLVDSEATVGNMRQAIGRLAGR